MKRKINHNHFFNLAEFFQILCWKICLWRWYICGSTLHSFQTSKTRFKIWRTFSGHRASARTGYARRDRLIIAILHDCSQQGTSIHCDAKHKRVQQQQTKKAEDATSAAWTRIEFPARMTLMAWWMLSAPCEGALFWCRFFERKTSYDFVVKTIIVR